VWGLERQCCSVNPRGRRKAERRMRWVAAYGIGSGPLVVRCVRLTFSFYTWNITRVVVSCSSVIDGTSVSQNRDTNQSG
jgi:hypothetical protein